MSRENTYTAIILKKQPYGEADEIITFFTKELGKVRGLAKSIKLSKSKLQQKLQALFLVHITLTRARLPKIIRAETIETFSNLRQSLPAVGHAFYAAELVMKATADEHKNEALFEALFQLFVFLNSADNQENYMLAVLRFKLLALKVLGLMPMLPENKEAVLEKYFFNPHKGGFVKQSSAGSWPVDVEAIKLLKELEFGTALDAIKTNQKALSAAQHLLSVFIEYYLERKMKSDNFRLGE